MHRLPNHDIINVFEGFAGYGGATFGLKRARINHNVIGFSEVDPDAIELYQYNFPNVPNFGDITHLEPDDIPDFDLFTGGFPCQPLEIVDVLYEYGEKSEKIVCPECGSEHLQKWNPKTGKCPKCGRDLEKTDVVLMVD